MFDRICLAAVLVAAAVLTQSTAVQSVAATSVEFLAGLPDRCHRAAFGEDLHTFEDLDWSTCCQVVDRDWQAGPATEAATRPAAGGGVGPE